ncbi:hypothetical protein [uncultured Desulfosarcina sp.]|uniref:hypothetical protein n=1 Tax=uncultured Desulfosarcina sp. TaxID=218289 RepID=UPI0029C8FD9A|nr:hypothetical protein [uncultured Desulfosarcina sp.]
MKHLPEVKTHRPPAPSRGARRLLTIAILASTLVVLAAGADWLLRVPRQDRAARAWMQALSLSTPALHTAGSPLRHPETVNPAVDLRFSPGLETDP